MTAVRNRPTKNYHALLVKPVPGFDPEDWRSKPKNYRIIEYIGPQKFEGRADAWRFQHNKDALDKGTIDCWAIWID